MKPRSTTPNAPTSMPRCPGRRRRCSTTAPITRTGSDALATVETNAAQKLIDKPTANRWRAVLKTAIAQQAAERDPKGALTLALEALALAPGLVPAAALAGKLLGAASDYRRASKVLETAFKETPHPDLAAVYLRVRHGDSTSGSTGARQGARAGRALRSGKPDDDRARRDRRARSQVGAAGA